ncbi:MAG TPA: hypothetical protein VIJ22_04150 [Polyangiaceae bacterium]
MPDSDPIPEIRELVGGRFAAVCSACMRPSAPNQAASAAHAWADLRRLGWEWIAPTSGTPGGVRCPRCVGQPAADGSKAVWKSRRKR